MRRDREGLRGGGVGPGERQVPRGDLRRGPRLPALRRRQGREGALPAGALGRREVPLRSRAARALPVQGGRQRRRGHQLARAGRQRRQLPERAGARRPRDVPDAARLGQRRRELPREGGRQGRRPPGLRLREAEPAARARHRRRLHAGVQPAGALLLRQREEEGRQRQEVRPHDRDERRPGASAATSSSSSSRRWSARRPYARARPTRRSTTPRASS